MFAIGSMGQIKRPLSVLLVSKWEFLLLSLSMHTSDYGKSPFILAIDEVMLLKINLCREIVICGKCVDSSREISYISYMSASTSFSLYPDVIHNRKAHV